MIEIELKITLDPREDARLRRDPTLARLRTRPRRTATLVSVYYDTPDHALARAGIALRLRKVGRRWIQTVKRGRGGGEGLFAQLEVERPAPGGRLQLGGPDPEDVYRSIDEATAGAPLSPVFETRVRRTVERLRSADGGEVELALDRGEIVAGQAREPIHEAEIELLSGQVGAVYDIAQLLFARGPVRLATANKSARGYRLAHGEPAPEVRPRSAGALDHGPDATVESVARDVFRDCHGQIAANMVAVADSEDIEGPHQLRVGLRRLRTALALFAPSLGPEVVAPLADEARRLGRIAGQLRDIDVLIDEVVAAAARLGLDAEAGGALTAALEARRTRVRAEVRRQLSAPGAAGFLFDLGRFVEGRGWLAPSDYSQTERLAAPISTVAAKLLDKRHAKVMKRGRTIRELDAEALHALRKELKKLRYTTDVLGPIYPGKKVARYLKSLKQLQDTFGTLNDAAMAGELLAGPDAPEDAAAQRGAGWVLGTLAVRVEQDRPRLHARWDRLEDVKPFWR